jgi:hypothetical protein
MSTLGALQILLIGLKLTGYITWSWYLVLIPFFISLTGWMFLFLLMGIVGLSAWREQRRNDLANFCNKRRINLGR